MDKYPGGLHPDNVKVRLTYGHNFVFVKLHQCKQRRYVEGVDAGGACQKDSCAGLHRSQEQSSKLKMLLSWRRSHFRLVPTENLSHVLPPSLIFTHHSSSAVQQLMCDWWNILVDAEFGTGSVIPAEFFICSLQF